MKSSIDLADLTTQLSPHLRGAVEHVYLVGSFADPARSIDTGDQLSDIDLLVVPRPGAAVTMGKAAYRIAVRRPDGTPLGTRQVEVFTPEGMVEQSVSSIDDALRYFPEAIRLRQLEGQP